MKIQLELEALLESGLAELGGIFGPRVWYEHILAEALSNEQYGFISTTDIREAWEEASDLLGRLNSLFLMSDLSQSQQDALELQIPLFRRISEPINGYIIEYEAFTQELKDGLLDANRRFAETADEAIQDVIVEEIFVYKGGKDRECVAVINCIFPTHPSRSKEVEALTCEESKDVALQKAVGTQYDAQRVWSAIQNYIQS